VQYRNIFRATNGGTDATDIGICARPDQWYTNFKDLEVCDSEKDCRKVGDACNYQWGRSSFATCGVAAAADKNGGNCTTDSDCAGDLRCVRRVNDAQTAYEFKCTDLSKLKTVGEACTDATQCKSQICLDSELRGPASGRRTMCAAPCGLTTSCGENQACVTVTQDDNSTEPTGDDSLVGFCVPRGPSTNSQVCKADADCRVANTACDVATGQCFDTTAHLGDFCNGDDRCPQGAICEAEDRICVIAGCDPGVATSCPEGTACLKGRGPIYNCTVP
jgi:hypothetical protein